MEVRGLPAVDSLVRRLDSRGLPRLLVVESARAALDQARAALLSGNESVDPVHLAETAIEALARLRPRNVINATGVLLHTNLGRAPLPRAAAEAASEHATGYGNLELDLATGDRGGRGAYVETLLRRLTGAAAALVVNNNAAGLFLTLAALAEGRPVPVSRGELIEIGGSYRLPELMEVSGARLVEVGTTNRTRVTDYGVDGAALLLKVHPSNYWIEGFTEQATLAELVALGRSRRIPVVFDAGSGLLDTATPWLRRGPPAWLAGEPGVRQALETGADLVLFSGDKLLGGPQAGIVVGSEDLVARLRRHPAARALRCGGPVLAALAATLELYARGDAAEEIPLWRMATAPLDQIERRATDLLAAAGVEGRTGPGESAVGAGSAPGSGIPTSLLVVDRPGADVVWPRLLAAEPYPVVARRDAGSTLIDPRTIDPEHDPVVARALATACGG
jgi:L-seryl-tRNA(Ser) seleniumtransferase